MHEKSGQPSEAANAYADRIISEIGEFQGEVSERVKRVLEAAFNDNEIRKKFDSAVIRYISTVGEVARAMLQKLNLPHEELGLMTIGDVDLPPFAQEIVDQIVASAHEWENQYIRQRGMGYDLEAKGMEAARSSVIELFDEHYDFSKNPGLKEKLANNMCLTSGGMCALDSAATLMISRALREERFSRIISPDNSFATWIAIVTERSNKGLSAKVERIETQPKNLLHLTAEDVRQFYETAPTASDLSKKYCNSWCITPVGNPSGTKMKPEQLTGVCRSILEYDPGAVIILDCTYVRTLKPEQARALMHGIVGNTDILKHTIFIESFSKTHGFCGERIGAVFSANDQLAKEIQNIIMRLTAGAPLSVSAHATAIAKASPEQKQTLARLNEFWAAERRGLFAYLRDPRYADLFDDKQEHILNEQLDEPLGLYLFMKLKEGVTVQQVALKTGCLGVPTKMGSGNYIRFSVGKITEEKYGKYAK